MLSCVDRSCVDHMSGEETGDWLPRRDDPRPIKKMQANTVGNFDIRLGLFTYFTVKYFHNSVCSVFHPSQFLLKKYFPLS